MTDSNGNDNATRNILVLLAAFFLFACPLLNGQTVLTLQQCLDLAKEKNLRLRISDYDVRTAELAHSELSKTKLPVVSLTAGASYAPEFTRAGYDPVVTNGGELSGQLAVQQPLYDGGIRDLMLDQAGLDIERTKLEHRISERDLTYDVQRAFIELLKDQQQIVLERQSVDQLAQYLDLTRRIAKGGMASATDVLKTQVQLSNATIALQQAQESAAAATYSLAELIGGAADTTFSVAGSLDSLLAPEDTLSGQPEFPAMPLDLSVAATGINKTLLDMEITHREKLPTISLYGSAGLLTSVDNLKLPSDERISPIGFLAGISFDMPLFNWGTTDLRVQERELAVSMARDQSTLLERSLRSEFGKTRLALDRAQERLREIRGSLQAAEDNYRLTTSKFAGGGALSLEVLSAQQLLTETRLSEVQALADIQNAMARIKQIMAK